MSEQDVETSVETSVETPVETPEETPEETPVENKSLESRVEELENKLSKLVDILNSCYIEYKNNYYWSKKVMKNKKSEMESL